MNRAILALLALPFATACSAAAEPVKSPADMAANEEPAIVVPVREAPPGTMEMDWTPPAEPEQKTERAKKMAQPHLTSNKNTRGRLFVLPTRREN